MIDRPFPAASRTGRRWDLRPAAPPIVDTLARSLRLSPLAARVLVARGLDADTAGAFLDARSGQFHDPYLLLGMDRAVPRIERALAGHEHVRLVTDYDVDGTTSCLILHAALDRRIAATGSGARISYHIPDRFTEGYGLSVRAVDAAIADGVQLLITADIGVRDHVTVARARDAGLDVIVVDHHLPAGESVPEAAYAVICPPQAGCAYPNKALAACGVSLKLAQALLDGDPRGADVLRSMGKLAAIGTVADVVDLGTPENRAIVALGLEALNQGRHGAGLNALIEVAGLHAATMSATDLGFRLGPRINAAGRLDDATAVVRLLRERDPAVALEQARALDQLNRARQDIQEAMVARARAAIADPAPPFVVVGYEESDTWHRGVAGIVAARVRDRLHRPCAIVTVVGEHAIGSVRSVPAIHAVHALDATADLLLRYGGHPVAAGFTLPAGGLADFTARLQAFVDDHGGDDALVPHEAVDVVVSPGALTAALVAELGRMEPCGKGNPPAAIVVEGPIDGIRIVKERHLAFRVGGVDAMWWGAAERRPLLEGADAVLGRAGVESWQGRSSVRLTVEDVSGPVRYS